MTVSQFSGILNKRFAITETADGVTFFDAGEREFGQFGIDARGVFFQIEALAHRHAVLGEDVIDDNLLFLARKRAAAAARADLFWRLSDEQVGSVAIAPNLARNRGF